MPYLCGLWRFANAYMFEYLRGDTRRGLIYGISFSQCISVFIWMNLGFLYLRQYTISKQKGGL